MQDKQFQFFTDGHRILNDSIFRSFSWKLDLGLILDWYHLTKKCKEQLSMALNGRKIRNEVLVELMPLLWHGLTPKAVDLLNALNDLIVSKRQKRNGMAWSREGSIALESITALKRNGEYLQWFEKEKVDFKMAA